jgi:hypothetical protein
MRGFAWLWALLRIVLACDVRVFAASLLFSYYDTALENLIDA